MGTIVELFKDGDMVEVLKTEAYLGMAKLVLGAVAAVEFVHRTVDPHGTPPPRPRNN